MLGDRHIGFSLSAFLAWLLWVKVIVDLVLSGVLHDDTLAYFGLASSAAAATLHIRSFFCTFAAQRREAFDFGVEVGRDREQARQAASDLRLV